MTAQVKSKVAYLIFDVLPGTHMKRLAPDCRVPIVLVSYGPRLRMVSCTCIAVRATLVAIERLCAKLGRDVDIVEDDAGELTWGTRLPPCWPLLSVQTRQFVRNELVQIKPT
eukprot:scaffold3664_cov407-Prasinococcus_capsulatus_cf.AAC.4